MKKYRNSIPGLFIVFIIAGAMSCKSGSEGKKSKAHKQDSIVLISSNPDGTGRTIEIEMLKGKAHNHPTFAIWLEDTNGTIIQTLFVTKAIAQGIFNYGDRSTGHWKPGELRRPSALPYWMHKRGVQNEYGTLEPTPANKIADAYTGATPAGNFKLSTRPDRPLSGKVKIVFEINQTMDWNEYWTNALYPDEINYKVSCQPALVYEASVDLEKPGMIVKMKPVGHSHYSGKNGELFTDLKTITTALHIAETITVTVK